MDDKTLFTIALTCAIAGLVSLFIVDILSVPMPRAASELQSMTDGEKARIDGQLLSYDTRGKAVILHISQECAVDAVYFGVLEDFGIADATDHDGAYEGGQGRDGGMIKVMDNLTIEGRISTYAGNRQLLVEKMYRQ